MLAQTPELEAHDKVLDNSRLNWNLEIGILSTCRGAKDEEDAVNPLDFLAAKVTIMSLLCSSFHPLWPYRLTKHA